MSTVSTARALRLTRLTQNAFATYGQIVDEENRALCVTLEKPWVDLNQDGISDKNVSCVPPGEYPASRYHSPKRGYDVFMLSGVPGRGDIELHIGNTPHDSEGCILLGSNFGDVGGQHGITGSQATFSRFMASLKGIDAFTLTVVDPAEVIT